jgi:hypothetical protein
LLFLESSSSSDFGRRPKRSSGFRLVANSYAKHQWAFVRQLGVPAAQQKAEEEDDNQRPKWDTAPPTTKREWKSCIALMMKKKTAALTECDASAPFRVSEFPACLLHLKPKKAFKEASLRKNVAGACGLALIRCGEIRFGQGFGRHDAP